MSGVMSLSGQEGLGSLSGQEGVGSLSLLRGAALGRTGLERLMHRIKSRVCGLQMLVMTYGIGEGQNALSFFKKIIYFGCCGSQLWLMGSLFRHGGFLVSTCGI